MRGQGLAVDLRGIEQGKGFMTLLGKYQERLACMLGPWVVGSKSSVDISLVGKSTFLHALIQYCQCTTNIKVQCPDPQHVQ